MSEERRSKPIRLRFMVKLGLVWSRAGESKVWDDNCISGKLHLIKDKYAYLLYFTNCGAVELYRIKWEEASSGADASKESSETHISQKGDTFKVIFKDKYSYLPKKRARKTNLWWNCGAGASKESSEVISRCKGDQPGVSCLLTSCKYKIQNK